MPSEGIPAAGLERADPAQPNRPRDVPERCINRPLWDAVDRGKIPCRKIGRHNIIDEGERLVGFEHPSGFDLQVVDGAPDLIILVDRHRTSPRIADPLGGHSSTLGACLASGKRGSVQKASKPTASRPDGIQTHRSSKEGRPSQGGS
jgi:hypothetical protein